MMPPGKSEALEFDNGIGGFAANGREYVIRLRHEPGSGLVLPPHPWINVVAYDDFGFLVSETGAGTTWSGNSREHRLTPWSNDPVTDPHGEALYLRDEESGAFWSPLPGPAPAPAAYETRHGFGSSRFLLSWDEIKHETTMLVPPGDPVKITRLRLYNSGKRARRFSAFAYARLVLGVHPEETAAGIRTEAGPDRPAIFAVNPRAESYEGAVAFASIHTTVPGARSSATTDRFSFLGSEGNVAAPDALRSSGDLDGLAGDGIDPCFAFRTSFRLAPGATADLWFLLGEGRDRAHAEEIIERHTLPESVERAETEAREFWRERLERVTVRTPDRALDLLLNGWLPYQAAACRLWGRTAFSQSGGAVGFRDQLQDAAAWIHHDPDLTRRQILLHAAHQFIEGDVLHWWHPPRSRGIRTRFADDLLWLPLVTAFYIRTTGDQAVLDREIPFLRGPALEPGEDERYFLPEISEQVADLYEHCCRAIDRSLTAGPHGLPLFGTGDWNDGMNRVGREGRGESVWMAFFLGLVIDGFLPLCESRGEETRARTWRERRDALVRAIEESGWDGEWYRRGYYDDGTPLGTALGDECRIDALVQAWAVLSGMARPERASAALEAALRLLASEEGRIIRLLDPPFQDTPRDPGYIKGYAPGVRENGGQYTHAALWVVRAAAELGWRDTASRLLGWINPVHRTRTEEEIRTYRLEPYVVSADIYGVPPHVGRGGWSWYTGSAGWMMRVGLETILGVQIENGSTLLLRPRIPDEWPECSIRLVWAGSGRDTVYEIRLYNPEGNASEVLEARMDGISLRLDGESARFPLPGDGGTHRLEVKLGPGASFGRAGAGQERSGEEPLGQRPSAGRPKEEEP